MWNIKSLYLAVLHELVTQKLKKKIFSPISFNIAQFYFHRIDREKLFEIDSLVIKIRCKMADLWHFKIFLFKHEASRSCAMHKVNV